MQPWIRIIRPVNLLLLAITMYAIDGFLLQPYFTTYGIQFSMDELHFFLLVLSTVMICAGGYIINDYFDQSIDKVNKPEKVFIGANAIAPNTAFSVYMILSFIGLGIGVYLSLRIDFWKLITVYVLAIAILYFYSASFKRMPLVGNFMVALLSGISVLMVFLYEPHLYQYARPGDYYIAGICTRFIITLAVFAFALTMVREIIKDLQDKEGDAQYGAATMPVKWGSGVARIIALLFLLLTLAALGYMYTNVLQPAHVAYAIYIGVIAFAALVLGVMLYIARTTAEYGRLSTVVKLIMLGGLSILPLHYFLTF